jgi:hypothetical protein
MKITVSNQNAEWLDCNEDEAEGYRQWLTTKLRERYQGAEIEVSERIRTARISIDLGAGDTPDWMIDEVAGFIGYCYETCPWHWV